MSLVETSPYSHSYSQAPLGAKAGDEVEIDASSGACSA
jgi:hypothetical protein